MMLPYAVAVSVVWIQLFLAWECSGFRLGASDRRPRYLEGSACGGRSGPSQCGAQRLLLALVERGADHRAAFAL